LQQSINEKNIALELRNKMLEENKKRINEEIFKYGQLNMEYTNLLNISKEETNIDNNNKNDNINKDDKNDKNNKNDKNEKKDKDIRNSFQELWNCLNKYKEIVPFLNNKLENVEKENKDLKEQVNKLSIELNGKNNETIKNKNKEIEDLKNQIKKINIEKDGLLKENIITKTENNLIKNDIIFIGNSLSSKTNNNNLNNNDNKEADNDNLLSELLSQLMEARNIISVLSPEK